MTRYASSEASPFLKWAGGKSQLLERFGDLYPPRFGTYHEPFLGGGAVFFRLWRTGRLRAGARLADVNPDLVLAYRMVRDRTDELAAALHELRARHDADHYYEARRRFNEEPGLSAVERAALVIYLNKTGFNGLYRVNAKGHFNVPLGRYQNPTVFDPDHLRACAAALATAQLTVGDFETALAAVQAGDFVYLDPPYVPITETAYFTAYAKDGFGFADQERLAATFRALDARGAQVMLSNHRTDALVALYEGYDVQTVPARRLINSRADRRDTDVAEVVIRNCRNYTSGAVRPGARRRAVMTP